MTSTFLQKTGRKLFAAHIEQYAPTDPLYEQYVNDKGEKRRRKRELPPGLSARDAKILKSVKRRAYRLDKGFSICGMRFGWAFIVGIIPGAGDVADIALNYYLVVCKARKADLPGWLVRRMLLNNSVSAIIGIVPFVGDILLAQFKANWRNAALLEEYLRIRGETYLEMKAEGKDVVPIGTEKPKSKGKLKSKKKDQKRRGAADDPINDRAAVRDEKAAIIPKGVSKSDLEQIKPGAGLEEGEVVRDVKGKMASVDEPGGTIIGTAAPTGKVTGKRRLIFTPWRKDGGSNSGKGKQVDNPGRFVEHLGSGGENTS